MPIATITMSALDLDKAFLRSDDLRASPGVVVVHRAASASGRLETEREKAWIEGEVGWAEALRISCRPRRPVAPTTRMERAGIPLV